MILELRVGPTAFGGTAGPRGVAGPPGPAGSGTVRLGQVATNCYIPLAQFAGVNTCNAISYHVICDDVASLQFKFAGFYAAELSPGAATSIKCEVEYPAGVYTRVTFDGGELGTIPNGGVLLSDPVALAVPRMSAIKVHTWQLNTSGILLADQRNHSELGERLEFGTDLPAKTGETVTTTGGTAAGYGPCAILALTARESIVAIGDSRIAGSADAMTSGTTGLGEAERSATLGRVPSINLGVGNQVIAGFSTAPGTALRRALADHGTVVICNLGIKDIFDGGTASAVIAEHQAIRALFPTKRYYVHTAAPGSISGNGWTDLDGQTSYGSDPQRAVLNAAYRAGVPGIDGVFDTAALFEHLRSGLWNPLDTPDGAHANQAAQERLARSGIVNLGDLHLPRFTRSVRAAVRRIMTLEELLVLDDFQPGDRVFLPALGPCGCEFVRGRTRWAPVGGAFVLASYAGSTSSPVASITGSTGEVAFTLPDGELILPAQLAVLCPHLHVETLIGYAGTAATTVRAFTRIGTTGTPSDAVTGVRYDFPVSNGALMRCEQQLSFPSANTVNDSSQGATHPSFVQALLTAVTGNINTSAAMKLRPTVQLASGADTAKLLLFRVRPGI